MPRRSWLGTRQNSAAVTDIPKRAWPHFERSQVAQHNDEATGHWLIIDGLVHDVSELMRTHPGGARILQLYAGRDASHGFGRVHHDRNPVALLLAQTRIGVLRDLACFTEPEHAAHAPAARAVVDTLALVVEMQNALAVDHAFQLAAPQGCAELSAPARRSRYELQRGLQTHARFHREYLDVLLGTTVSRLASTILAADSAPRQRVHVAEASHPAAEMDARTSVLKLLDRFESLRDDELAMHVACFEVLDSWLLGAWKSELLRAERALERAHAAALRPCELPAVYDVCERLMACVYEYFRHASSVRVAGG